MQIQPYLSNVITTNFVNACWRLELETKPREVLQCCPEMAPARAVSLLEARTLLALPQLRLRHPHDAKRAFKLSK